MSNESGIEMSQASATAIHPESFLVTFFIQSPISA